MLRYNARNNSQGFTLVETLTIVIVIGILSAIAAPSFLALLNRSKVNDALAKVRGALQEVQREAIRQSRTCRVALTPSNQPKLTSNCFQTADYIIKVSAVANPGDTTVTVDSLPVAISNGTGLVFSRGSTGVVTQDAAAASTSLTLSGGISAKIAIGEIVAFRTLPDQVAMATNLGGSPPAITFSFKGNTTVALPVGANSAKTVLYMSDGSGQKKCLAISNGIGIMRTGDYNGSTSATDITAGSCTTSK